MAFVNFFTTPSGARILLGGGSFGTTPLTNINLPEGRYDFTFEKEGYVTMDIPNYYVPASGAVEIRRTLTPISDLPGDDDDDDDDDGEPIQIHVDSTPRGARIYIDGSAYTVTPGSPNTTSGIHEIVLRLDGYRDFITTRDLRDGQSYHFTMLEEPEDPLPDDDDESGWTQLFRNALSSSFSTALSFFSSLTNNIKDLILRGMAGSSLGRTLLENWGRWLADKLVDEAEWPDEMKDMPHNSISILAILGIIGGVLGFGTIVNWLKKEIPEPLGMAVWAAIEAEDWELANQANENYRNMIENANAWLVEVASFLNPVMWLFMRDNKESQLQSSAAYQEIIDNNLGILDLPEILEVPVRDIIDGDTIDTALEAFKPGFITPTQLPEYSNTGHARIRLVGINAPEKSPKGEILCTDIEITEVEKEFADISRDVLLPLNDKTVTLYIDPEHTLDTHGRILAKVVHEGEDVGLSQIKKGLACWYFRETNKYINDDLYKTETLRAQEEGTGMWETFAMANFKILITSDPDNAKIFIDGNAAHHNTPMDEEEASDILEMLMPGEHEIKVTKAGMEATRTVTLTDGDNGTIHLELGAPGLPGEAAGLTFNVTSSPDNARLFLDGVALHHNSPMDQIEARDVIHLFTLGSHVLRATKGGQAAEQTINVIDGDMGTIHLVLGDQGLPPPGEPPTPPPAGDCSAHLATIASLQSQVASLQAQLIACQTGQPPPPEPPTEPPPGEPPTPPPEPPPEEGMIIQSWTPGEVGPDDIQNAIGTTLRIDFFNDGSYANYEFQTLGLDTSGPELVVGNTQEGWPVGTLTRTNRSAVRVWTGALRNTRNVYYRYVRVL